MTRRFQLICYGLLITLVAILLFAKQGEGCVTCRTGAWAILRSTRSTATT